MMVRGRQREKFMAGTATGNDRYHVNRISMTGVARKHLSEDHVAIQYPGAALPKNSLSLAKFLFFCDVSRRQSRSSKCALNGWGRRMEPGSRSTKGPWVTADTYGRPNAEYGCYFSGPREGLCGVLDVASVNYSPFGSTQGQGLGLGEG